MFFEKISKNKTKTPQFINQGLLYLFSIKKRVESRFLFYCKTDQKKGLFWT